MAEREITLTIKGQNLSAAAFADARKELLGLSGDTRKATEEGDKLGPAFKASFTAIGAGVAVAAGAIGGLAAGIVALGQQGATVSDVRAQFDVLNKSAGNSADTLLGKLRQAVRGTISDFELMQSTNKALSQGLKLNEDQFSSTALAARVLADRTGGDTAEAFNTLTTAMATGRDMTLKTIGMNIDAKAAVEAYAASIGRTSGELTEAQTIEAKRTAILQEMQRVVQESGEAEVDFADRIDQAKVALQNYRDQLGEAIANSPVFSAGLEAISSAFSNAFGDKSQSIIKFIMDLLEGTAINLTHLGEVGISVTDGLVQAFNFVKAALLGTVGGVVDFGSKFDGLVASVKEFMATMPGADAATRKTAAAAREAADQSKAMAESLKSQAAEAWKAANGQSEVSAVLGRVRGALVEARTAMEAARKETGQHDDATKNLGAAIRNTNTAAEASEGSIGKMTAAQKKAADEAKKAADAVHKFWEDVRDVGGSFKFPDIPGVIGAQLEKDLRDTIPPRLKNGFEAAFSELRPAVKTYAQTHIGPGLLDGFGDSIKQGLGPAILGALQGGGSAFQSAGASIGGSFAQHIMGNGSSGLSGFLTKNLGSTLGGVFGSIIPGLGTMLGGMLGGLTDKLFGKLFKSEGKAVNDARDQFTAIQGGIEALVGKLEAANASGLMRKFYAADTQKEWLAAQREIEAAIGSHASQIDLARQAGEEYGLTLAELGPTLRNQELGGQAERFTAQWEALTAVQADMVAVASKMGPAVSDYVKRVRDAGGEVPRSMQPMIRAMIENKTLVDENGQAITDMASIPFAEDITAGMKDVAASMRELADTLRTGLPSAFEAGARSGENFTGRVGRALQGIPREIEIEINGTYNEPENMPSGDPGHRVGTMGRYGSWFHDFGTETATTVHDREAIITERQAPAFVADYLARMPLPSAPVASAQPSSVNVYMAVDQQSGRVRVLGDVERRQIQTWLYTGEVSVPQQNLVGRRR